MPATIDGYRCKLINKILFAASQDEVQRFIDAALRGLKEHKVHDHIINRFLDKTIASLEDFNAFDCSSNQWANIHMSKIVFNRIKSSFSPVK